MKRVIIDRVSEEIFIAMKGTKHGPKLKKPRKLWFVSNHGATTLKMYSTWKEVLKHYKYIGKLA